MTEQAALFPFLRPWWVVTGKPAEGATVPVHATIKKPLNRISNWL